MAQPPPNDHAPPDYDVDAHVEAFNAAVTDRDWDRFAERFADDAVLEFVGPAVGPFAGRDAILGAYTTSPPDDTVELIGPVTLNGDELIVPYRWRGTGATGTMRITTTGRLIARLVVTFD